MFDFILIQMTSLSFAHIYTAISKNVVRRKQKVLKPRPQSFMEFFNEWLAMPQA